MAFIGDKKGYLEHRVDSFAQFRSTRYFAQGFGLAEHSLGAYDALAEVHLNRLAPEGVTGRFLGKVTFSNIN